MNNTPKLFDYLLTIRRIRVENTSNIVGGYNYNVHRGGRVNQPPSQLRKSGSTAVRLLHLNLTLTTNRPNSGDIARVANNTKTVNYTICIRVALVRPDPLRTPTQGLPFNCEPQRKSPEATVRKWARDEENILEG